jgi:hypothetical protein
VCRMSACWGLPAAVRGGCRDRSVVGVSPVQGKCAPVRQRLHRGDHGDRRSEVFHLVHALAAERRTGGTPRVAGTARARDRGRLRTAHDARRDPRSRKSRRTAVNAPSAVPVWRTDPCL